MTKIAVNQHVVAPSGNKKELDDHPTLLTYNDHFSDGVHCTKSLVIRVEGIGDRLRYFQDCQVKIRLFTLNLCAIYADFGRISQGHSPQLPNQSRAASDLSVKLCLATSFLSIFQT